MTTNLTLFLCVCLIGIVFLAWDAYNQREHDRNIEK